MRKIIPLQLLTALFYLPLIGAPYVPTLPTGSPNPNVIAPVSTPYSPTYTQSYVQGNRIVTNYYDPNAGPDVGPGLSTSPLDARLNAPLGTSWQATSPVVPIYSGPQSVYTNALQPVYTGTPGYTTTTPAASVYAPSIVTPIPAPYSHPYSPRGLGQPTSGGGLGPSLSHYEEPTYFFPGLLRFSIDKWIGSEYLYDLPADIGVVVEVLVPKELSEKFNTVRIRDDINASFKAIGITPRAESLGDKPPLPFFHLLAYVVPVEDAYVLSLSGRLFEAVLLPRINFQISGTNQAITWEKQEMVLSSKAQLTEQLYGTSQEIAMAFADRVSYFKKLRAGQQKELKAKAKVVPVTNLMSPFLHPKGPCCE